MSKAANMYGDHDLSALFAEFRPDRHLELGTFEGETTLIALKACDTTVWTVHPREGERDSQQNWLHSRRIARIELESLQKSCIYPRYADVTTDADMVAIQTDARGMIGSAYLTAGLGHRVGQIYGTFETFSARAFPDHFFDTILINPIYDTRVYILSAQRTFRLLRPGGHLFFPAAPEAASPLYEVDGKSGDITLAADMTIFHRRQDRPTIQRYKDGVFLTKT